MTFLGPATEARFQVEFADRATITAKAAAKLIGLDVKVLRAMTASGDIQACPRGSRPTYSEAVLRAYLINPPPIVVKPKEPEQCPSTNRPKAASGSTTSSSAGRGFMDRPVRLRVVQPRP
jgi:hypothetical protein